MRGHDVAPRTFRQAPGATSKNGILLRFLLALCAWSQWARRPSISVAMRAESARSLSLRRVRPSPSRGSTSRSARSSNGPGPGTGTIYRHLPQRVALVDAIFEERTAELVEVVERAPACEDTARGLRLLLLASPRELRA